MLPSSPEKNVFNMELSFLIIFIFIARIGNKLPGKPSSLLYIKIELRIQAVLHFQQLYFQSYMTWKFVYYRITSDFKLYPQSISSYTYL